MIYLEEFRLPDDTDEYWLIAKRKNIYNTNYPFRMFPEKGLEKITFEPVTMFYGGNGSGKTTLLNIISEKLSAKRRNPDDRGEQFHMYVNACQYEMSPRSRCREIKYICSDDVFDYLLDMRAVSSRVNRRKEALSEEYLTAKYDRGQNSMDAYEELKNRVDARRMTASAYIRSRLVNNTPVQQSNGESALAFWQNEITEDTLYIIDEPENSLSAENQIRLKEYIEESARFYSCQLIIASHSPFLLSIEHAKIYDLDAEPVCEKKWEELENVRTYYDFFHARSGKFEGSD